jgi:hypothetical protein
LTKESAWSHIFRRGASRRSATLDERAPSRGLAAAAGDKHVDLVVSTSDPLPGGVHGSRFEKEAVPRIGQSATPTETLLPPAGFPASDDALKRAQCQWTLALTSRSNQGIEALREVASALNFGIQAVRRYVDTSEILRELAVRHFWEVCNRAPGVGPIPIQTGMVGRPAEAGFNSGGQGSARSRSFEVDTHVTTALELMAHRGSPTKASRSALVREAIREQASLLSEEIGSALAGFDPSSRVLTDICSSARHSLMLEMMPRGGYGSAGGAKGGQK